MKKVTMAAVVALSMPMMANADVYEAIVGKVSLKSSGACYGIKFKGNGKADPTLPSEIRMQIDPAAEAGDSYQWADILLGANTILSPEVLTGQVVERKKSKLTLGISDPADQKRAATALLEYAGNNGAFFGNILANASVVSYTVTASLDKTGSKVTIKEIAEVNSSASDCTATAKVTRQWKAVRI